MMTKYVAKFAAVGLVCAMVLAACGGGGGGNAPAVGGPALSDRFAPVRDLVCSGAESSGWCWQNPQPPAEIVGAVFFLDAKVGWAAGQWGWIQKTTDGGATWTRLPVSGFHFNKIAFADPMNGWALWGDRNSVMHTTDGGVSWERQVTTTDVPSDPAQNWSYTNLHVVDSRRVVISGSSSWLRGHGEFAIGTDDAGAHWRPILSGTNIHVTPGGTVLALTQVLVTESGGGYRSTDLGLTRGLVGPLPACSPKIASVDSLKLWAYCSGPTTGSSGTDQPHVYRSDDGGVTWRDMAATFPSVGSRNWTFGEVKLNAQGEGWGVLRDNTNGTNSDIKTLRASAGAASWTPITLPASLQGATLPLDWVVDPQTLWLLKDGQALWTENGGATWQALTVPQEAGPPLRLKRDAGGGLLAEYFAPHVVNGQVQGDDPAKHHFYRSVDSGKTWRRVPGGNPTGEIVAMVRGLWFFDGSRGLALTQDGGLMDTVDSGRNWVRRPGAQATPCCTFTGRLQFTAGGTGWMLSQGQLMRSTDSGRNWVAASVPTAMSSLKELQFLNDRQGWAVTLTGQLFATADGGATWLRRPDVPGLQFRLVQFVDDKTGLAWVRDSAHFESLWRTTDGGETWLATSMSGRSGTGVSKIYFVDTNNVWMVGTWNERIWRSRDGGKFWDAPAVPTGQFTGLYDIQFVDAQRGWVVGAEGAVLSTSDGGQSWQRQDTATAASVTFATMFWRDAETGWLGGGPAYRSPTSDLATYLTSTGGPTIMATVTSGR